MLSRSPSTVWRKYFTVLDFTKKFPDEDACEKHLISIKYPEGFICKCGCIKYYKLRGNRFKRRRILQCQSCKRQCSITANTVFSNSKVSLLKWFWAFYYVSQSKKGISGRQLSKNIGVSESTARLMLYKIRKEMEEDAITYQIGGPGKVVEADEFDVGGHNSEKQKSLILLEKDKKSGKLGRVRFAPMPDKSFKSLELNVVPMVAAGTTLHTDGNKTYVRLTIRYFRRLKLIQVANWEENNSHEFLNDLNTITGLFKTWYRGVFHHFSHKNIAYYFNEFCYRFNRRRSEGDIFNHLLNRSIVRSKNLKQKEFRSPEPYLPLAA